MGPIKRAVIKDRCPWSFVYNDSDAAAYLRAYGVVERWREWPPGPRDPRLMEALSVLATEHNAVDRDSIPKTTPHA